MTDNPATWLGQEEWLRSRRHAEFRNLASALIALDKALAAARLELPEYKEVQRLQKLISNFDHLIFKVSQLKAEELQRQAEAARKKARRPRPPKVKTGAQAEADVERRKANVERRRSGFAVLREPSPEQEARLEPPALPVPVHEVERIDERSGDHVIADDVSRRAAGLIASGYSFGRRRSRRYEGLR